MTNHTQPSQQVPVAISDAEVIKQMNDYGFSYQHVLNGKEQHFTGTMSEARALLSSKPMRFKKPTGQPVRLNPLAVKQLADLIMALSLRVAEQSNNHGDTVLCAEASEAAQLLAQSTPDAGLAEDAKRWRALVRQHGTLGSHGEDIKKLAVCEYYEPKQQWFYLQTPLVETIDALASQEPQHG